MDAILPKELEAFVQQLIDGGHFDCPAQAIETGLWLLKDQYELYKIKRDELKKLIAVGIEQADRGEVIDGELVFGKLREKIEKNTGRAP